MGSQLWYINQLIWYLAILDVFDLTSTLVYHLGWKQQSTYLSSDDGRPHHQQHQLVEKEVEESNHGLELGRVERGNAGLELRLQVVLHDAHVPYPDGEHVLVQGVHQGKELVQELVLDYTEGEVRVQQNNIIGDRESDMNGKRI